MYGPIKIDPERVHILDSNDFTRLYNDLLRAEAGLQGIPQHLVDTTVRDKAPDGGVDCRVSDAPPAAGLWIPEAGSVHQLKAGDAPSPKELEEELTKSESQAAFDRGDAYVFALAEPITARRKRNLLAKINEEYKRRDLPLRGSVLTAAEIAEWTEQHLAIAVRVFDVPVIGWYPVEQWERQEQYANEFIDEEGRAEVIAKIHAGIAAGERLIRIIGTAGTGKSRTVLEAVRLRGLRERVLYARDAADVAPDFFWYLANQNPDGSGLLVIDECTLEELPKIRGLADPLPGGYTVVAVGPLQFGARGGNAIEVPPLDVDALAAIIGSLVPIIAEPIRRAIASRCGGSPKLAVLIGTELARDTARLANWEEVERSENIVEYLNQKIFPLGVDDPKTVAMRAVSLFTRLGWRDEMVGEGRTVVDFLGGNWPQVRIGAEQLIQRGVLSPRGRYLYPTPDILANFLTRETLRAYGTELRDLFASLPEDAQRSFAERLRQIGDEPGARDVVERILGDTGFFRGLADLNNPRVAGLLHQLVPAFPELTVRQLERMLGVASHDALLGLDAGRRHIVWALEELAWWEDYFPAAGRLLLRLASAENESIANNATGIWKRLYQVWLGGTSASFTARLSLLDEALANPNPDVRRLGVAALSSALQTQHIMRFGGPPENIGKLPPQEWQPANNGEWVDIVRMCLIRLANALTDDDEQVHTEAARTVADRSAELIRSGFVTEWAEVASRLVGAPFELRKPVLDAISGELSHRSGQELEDQSMLERVEAALQGSDFSDRLRRVVSSWDYEFERYGREKRGTGHLDRLAREVLQTPDLLRSEVAWLSGGEASSGWGFGKRLGVLDEDDALLEMMLSAWRDDVRDERFLAGYFAGTADRHGPEWLEDLLDTWADIPELPMLVAVVTWHALSSDRAARRLEKLIAMRRVPASFLRRMISGFWARDVSAEALGSLIATAEDSGADALSGCVGLLAQYLDEYPNRLPALHDLARRALEQGAGKASGPMDAFYWARLARLLMPENPVWLAQLCIEVAEAEAGGRPHRLDEEIQKVLAETLEIGGWNVFENVIGPALIKRPQLLWVLDNPFRGRRLLQSLDPDRLIAWIAEAPEARLTVVAGAVPVIEAPETETDDAQISSLARALLTHFGNHQEVRSRLAATLLTGVWRGQESTLLLKRIAMFDRWAKDEDDNVRSWASELAESHRHRLPKVLMREEEEV